MKLKTKFNVDDFVYVMFDNKIEKLKVSRIQMDIQMDNNKEECCIIKYIMINNINTFELIYEEKFVFKTKKELLESL
jgi:hypothetical protein